MPSRQKPPSDNEDAPRAKKPLPSQEAPGLSDYDRDCLLLTRALDLMDAHDKVAFCFLVSVVNTKAYNDATKTASEWFLTWDILEDAMPFLTQPAIYVDIQWTKRDLEQKVQDLGLEKQQIVILINQSALTVIPQDSAVQSYPCAVPSLLDPTRVVMDATMSYVQKVGHGFLRDCSSLKEVDLSRLSNVKEVGNGFLSLCSSLKEVDLSGLSNVQKVGDAFLSECFSLKKVDLSGLTNVQKVGNHFLYECSSLTRVILPTSPPECLRRALRGLPATVKRTVK